MMSLGVSIQSWAASAYATLPSYQDGISTASSYIGSAVSAVISLGTLFSAQPTTPLPEVERLTPPVSLSSTRAAAGFFAQPNNALDAVTYEEIEAELEALSAETEESQQPALSDDEIEAQLAALNADLNEAEQLTLLYDAQGTDSMLEASQVLAQAQAINTRLAGIISFSPEEEARLLAELAALDD